MSENPLLDLDEIKDAAISPATGISALALNFAMKFWDINTVQEGTLYQQFKLEGRNMQGLHLDMVFDVARQFERHIMDAPNRLTAMVFDEIENALLEDASGTEARSDETEGLGPQGDGPARDSGDAEQ